MFSLFNTGEADLTIDRIRAYEGVWFDANFDEDIVIEPDSSYEVAITFTPDRVGMLEGTLSIESNAYVNRRFYIALSGGGIVNSVSKKEDSIPTEFILSAAYPNPFNSSTNFTYELPIAAEILIQVYDLSGQVVTTLYDGYKQLGTYTIALNASALSTGLYFVRLESSDKLLTQKIMLIR